MTLNKYFAVVNPTFKFRQAQFKSHKSLWCYVIQLYCSTHCVFQLVFRTPTERDTNIRPDISGAHARNKTQTNKQTKQNEGLNARRKFTYYCTVSMLFVMCSTYRFNHFLIFDFTVSFAEMHGLLLILVCGLYHPVTLSDMLEAMEGQ